MGMKYVCKNANAEYKNKSWLIEHHHQKEMSLAEMANLMGHNQTTVSYWMKQLGVEIIKRQYPKIRPRKIGKLWTDNRGYVHIILPDHPQASRIGYVFQHRVVAEEILGRPLLSEEVVHHINENRADNRKENLMVFPSKAAHLAYHRTLRKEKNIARKKPRNYRPHYNQFLCGT